LPRLVICAMLHLYPSVWKYQILKGGGRRAH